MLLLGHRGARRSAPENTLAAFELALAHGCHGFEFDVRLTADKRAVICHDTRVGYRLVARNTHAGLIARCPALATLEDVLEGFAARAYLYIELKTAGAEDCVLRFLEKHPPRRGYVVASFIPEVLTSLRRRDGSVLLGYICDMKAALPRWRELPVEHVMPHHRLVTRELIDELHAAGKQVFVWTVNRRREMLALAAMGADAVLSDDTELLARTLGQP